MKTVALTLTFLASLFIVGCKTKDASPVDMTAGPNESALSFTLPTSIPSDQILEAAKSALIRRSWEGVAVNGNEITASLNHRDIDASLRIAVEGSTINIYSDSWRLNKDGSRKKREHPEGWIRNLEKDIRAALGAELN